MPGGMRFERPWDFDQGNKPIFLNDLLSPDAEVLAAMQSLIEAAGGSSVTLDADGTLTVEATTVELATDAQLTAHEADTTNVHGIADTSALATDAEVAAAVSAHEADTTNVHGIADTADLVDTATLSAALADVATSFGGRTPSGRYIFNCVTGGTTNDVYNLGVGVAHFFPLWISSETTVDEFKTAIGTVGGGGAVVRMFLYEADPDTGLPGALVVDGGTVAITAGTGDKSVSITPTVLAPGAYFIGMVTNDAAARFRALGSSPLPSGWNWLGLPGPNTSWGRFVTATGYTATSAAPNPASLTGVAIDVTGDVPVVCARVV